VGVAANRDFVANSLRRRWSCRCHDGWSLCTPLLVVDLDEENQGERKPMNTSRAVALRPPLAGPSDARLPLPVRLVVVAIVPINAAGCRQRVVEASTGRLIMLALTSNANDTVAEPSDMSRSRIGDGEAEWL
ncbi:unnamed protein product, partial [Ectocarpus sp. 12 AP-2014]